MVRFLQTRRAREVSQFEKESLNILGSEGRLDLEYEYQDWNTRILQYSFITESG